MALGEIAQGRAFGDAVRLGQRTARMEAAAAGMAAAFGTVPSIASSRACR